MIKLWKHKGLSVEYFAKLYLDKLVLTIKYVDKKYKNTYTLRDLFERNLTVITVNIYYEIYKEAVKLPKPKKLSKKAKKKWVFWSAINNSNIKEERIIIEENKFFLKSKYGCATGYIGENKEQILDWQTLDDFFFYGPKMHNINLLYRIRIQNEIFKSLTEVKHKLTLKNDSFVIFDYNKIEKISFEKNDGMTGIYFKIENGRCIVGGWDNPRDGGENSTSIEYLWYNLDSRIPKVFASKKKYIKNILNEGIIGSGMSMQQPRENIEDSKPPETPYNKRD